MTATTSTEASVPTSVEATLGMLANDVAAQVRAYYGGPQVNSRWVELHRSVRAFLMDAGASGPPDLAVAASAYDPPNKLG